MISQLGIIALFAAGLLAGLVILGWVADNLISEERVDAFVRNHRGPRL